MQRMLGAQSSLILQGLWQLTAHKSRRTLLRTKYLIQSQQQFAKRLTFIFYFGSKKIKGIPRLSKLSATSLQHTKQPFHLCYAGHRCAGGLLQTHSLIPPSQGQGKKSLVSWWGPNSPPRRHVIYQPCVLLTWQRALKLPTCSHTWSHNHTGRRSVPEQPSLRDVAHHLHGLGHIPQMKLRGREIFLLFKRTMAAWMKP